MSILHSWHLVDANRVSDRLGQLEVRGQFLDGSHWRHFL